MMHDMIDQAAYMAHGYCLLWKPWLIAAHAGSDFVIFASYFAIPVAIWLFLRKRKDMELRPLAFMFAAFIFLCGLTHIIQGLTLWWPIYETQAYVKIATAIVSLITAISIFPLIPIAIAVPSPRQLRIVNEGLALEVAAHRQTFAELKSAKEDLERRVAERTRELEHAKARFEALVRASTQIVWTSNAKGEVVEDSPGWRSLTGQSLAEFKGNGWLDALHVEDRAGALAAWQTSVQTQKPYAVEYRLRDRVSGWRWTAATGVPLIDSDGAVYEWVGMNTDIDGRRRSEDHMRFVMQELSHRTKNLLTVIYAMARQAARQIDPTQFMEDFGERILGLSRSHDLLVSTNWMGVPLQDHLRSQLQPFASFDQVRISGPSLSLRPAATQALGLAFHELATNAVKHGALASPDGRIDIQWEVENSDGRQYFRLRWTECSREFQPKHIGKGSKSGFGYTVLNRVVPEAISGVVKHYFGNTGIVWKVEAPLGEIEALVHAPSQREEQIPVDTSHGGEGFTSKERQEELPQQAPIQAG